MLVFCLLCEHRQSCEVALTEKHLRDVTQIEGFIDEFTDTTKQLDALNSVFSKAAEFDTPVEVKYFIVDSRLPIACFSYIYFCNFRYQTTYAAESHLIYSVILSLLQVVLHMRGQSFLSISRRFLLLLKFSLFAFKQSNT